jgi:hypothetical protein
MLFFTAMFSFFDRRGLLSLNWRLVRFVSLQQLSMKIFLRGGFANIFIFRFSLYQHSLNLAFLVVTVTNCIIRTRLLRLVFGGLQIVTDLVFF